MKRTAAGRLTYIKESGPFVAAVGARVVHFGKPKELLEGEEDGDVLMLVEYPSRQAFLKMTQNPNNLKIHQLRAEGVERAVLCATDPIKFQAILAE